MIVERAGHTDWDARTDRARAVLHRRVFGGAPAAAGAP